MKQPICVGRGTAVIYQIGGIIVDFISVTPSYIGFSHINHAGSIAFFVDFKTVCFIAYKCEQISRRLFRRGFNIGIYVDILRTTIVNYKLHAIVLCTCHKRPAANGGSFKRQRISDARHCNTHEQQQRFLKTSHDFFGFCCLKNIQINVYKLLKVRFL